MAELPESALVKGAPSFTPLGIAILLAGFTVLAFISLGFVTQTMNLAFGVWFTEIFIFIGLPFVVLRAVGRDPLRYPGVVPAPSSYDFALGFGLGFLNLLAIGLPLQLLTLWALPEWLRELFATDPTRVFKQQTQIELTMILLGVGVLAAIGEEYFFRGIFLRGLLHRMKSSAGALVVCGLWFAFCHFDPIGFLARTELGILFGWLYLRTRSIWPAVMAHAANNVTSTVMYFASTGQPEPETLGIGWEEARGVLLVAVLAAFPLYALWRNADRRLEPVLPFEDDATVEPTSFWSALSPWFGAALVSLLLLFAVDRRGVELNFVDARYPLPKVEGEPSAERSALDELRRNARRGEVPVEDYKQRRRELSERK
jgi:membrane protease YdiL (CAAX protease family)